MKTKEISFTLPVMIVLYEVFFFRGKWGKRILVLIPFVLTMLIIPLSMLGVDRPLGEIIGDVSDVTRVQSPLSRWEYLATQGRVIMTYLRLVVLPVNQNLDYDYPVYRSLFDPAVLGSFGVLLLLAGAGIYLYMRSRRGEPLQRLVAYGIFWFFITLSVESSVIPITDVIFEHRMYLPLVGVFLAIGAEGVFIAGKLKEKKREVKKGIAAGFTVIVLLLAVVTFVRNRTWGDEITLWQDVVRKSPQKARPYFNLGIAYFIKGNTNDSMEAYQTALRLKPDYAKAHNNLGALYLKIGLMGDAIQEYQTALRVEPNFAEAYYNLGNVYQKIGRMNDAIQEYKSAITLRPNYAEAHNNLGVVYQKMGRMYEALQEYQTALKFQPDDAEKHYNLGNVYFELGQITQARKEYETTLMLNPNLAGARNRLKYIPEYFDSKEKQE